MILIENTRRQVSRCVGHRAPQPGQQADNAMITDEFAYVPHDVGARFRRPIGQRLEPATTGVG